MEINITLLNSFVAVLPDTTNSGVESMYLKKYRYKDSQLTLSTLSLALSLALSLCLSRAQQDARVFPQPAPSSPLVHDGKL